LVTLSAHAENYSANAAYADSNNPDNEDYRCYENNYLKSKFDYKSHYVTSLRFTLPARNCAPKSANSLYKKYSNIK